MPRFAANLSMMFTEVPFIERFAAARKAGFDAVEFLFPYDYSTLQIQKQLEQNHLTLALFTIERQCIFQCQVDVCVCFVL
ncbi:hypothetical protein ACUODJ_03130, partial [Escherichia sp. HC-CC]